MKYLILLSLLCLIGCAVSLTAGVSHTFNVPDPYNTNIGVTISNN